MNQEEKIKELEAKIKELEQANKMKDKIIELEKKADKLEKKCDYLTKELKDKEFRLNWALNQLFGRKNEKKDNLNKSLWDVNLFGEESLIEEMSSLKDIKNELDEEEKAHKIVSKANHPKLNEFRDSLEKEIHEIKLKEGSCCPICGKELVEVGYDELNKIIYIPGTYKRLVIRKYKYTCPNKYHEDGTSYFVQTEYEDLFNNSFASPKLVANIIYKKYVESVPFYRQQETYKAQAIPFTRQLMCNWSMKACEVFKHIYDALLDKLLSSPVIQADETPIKVIQENGKEGKKNSYMTAYANRDSGIIIYKYCESRSGANICKLIKDYGGYVVTDNYAGYGTCIPSGRRALCCAHARRRFTDLIKNSSGDNNVAKEFIYLFSKLYAIEDKISELNPDDKLKVRQSESKPVMMELKDKLDHYASLASPKGALGKAIAYMRDDFELFTRFLDNGLIPIDNNFTEREAMKPFVIGRKNFLFFDTKRGVESGEIIYSVIRTAKMNNINIESYLAHLMENHLAVADPAEVNDYLPMSKKIQEEFGVKK